MGKVRKDISLDIEVNKVVKQKTEDGEFCLSKYVNTALRDKFRDLIKTKEEKS